MKDNIGCCVLTAPMIPNIEGGYVTRLKVLSGDNTLRDIHLKFLPRFLCMHIKSPGMYDLP